MAQSKQPFPLISDWQAKRLSVMVSCDVNVPFLYASLARFGRITASTQDPIDSANLALKLPVR
jgi:hypothetical protein